MTKLLILDKDGTLVRPKSGEKFVQHPEDQELIPGVSDAIARYAADGWMMAIASNQGGVDAGYKTLEDAIAEMQYAMMLSEIECAFFCPDMDGKQCYSIIAASTLTWACDVKALHRRAVFPLYRLASYRKPGFGMLQEAASYWSSSHWELMTYKGFRPEAQILMVGDRPEDQQAAKNAGVDFLWAHEWVYQSTGITWF
jgi:D-glycero-D-manno-heptose 1,7-bisphosphate phosphatase